MCIGICTVALQSLAQAKENQRPNCDNTLNAATFGICEDTEFKAKSEIGANRQEGGLSKSIHQNHTL